MKFSIALFGYHDNARINVAFLGEKVTEVEARAYVADSGTGEYLVGFAQFNCDDNLIFHAIGCSAGDDGLGSKLEKFAQFCFDLGRKMGEKV